MSNSDKSKICKKIHELVGDLKDLIDNIEIEKVRLDIAIESNKIQENSRIIKKANKDIEHLEKEEYNLYKKIKENIIKLGKFY